MIDDGQPRRLAAWPCEGLTLGELEYVLSSIPVDPELGLPMIGKVSDAELRARFREAAQQRKDDS